MNTKVNEIASQYTKLVEQTYPLKAAYLYGSHVKGIANTKSDIDIAIVVDPMDSNNFMDMFGGLFSIASQFDEDIEPNLLIDNGDDDKYSFFA